MAERLLNNEFGFASRINNIKEASQGNKTEAGLAVTEQGPTALAVDIASGTAFVDHAYVSIGATSKTVTAADPTDDRLDIISLAKTGTVTYTAGTASANPIPPNLPANEILLATILVNAGATVIVNADITDNRIVEEQPFVPIGAMLPWAKSLAGVPATLPTNYVECNGQVLSDTESPLDGTTLPDLNVTQRFLRGASTSGTTGGDDQINFTTQEAGPDATPRFQAFRLPNPADNKPAFYEVVWIIRVK